MNSNNYFYNRYITGPTLHDALIAANNLSLFNINAEFNILGESIIINEFNTYQKYITFLMNEFYQLIDSIKGTNYRINIQPTMFGLNQTLTYVPLCAFVIGFIISYAKFNNIFVWINIESYQFCEPTLQLFERLANVHDNVGITLQSYLKRTKTDLINFVAKNYIIRIVKGAYTINDFIGYIDESDQLAHFWLNIKYLFENSNNFAIGTHQIDTLNYIGYLKSIYSTIHFEIHMLKGIHEDYLKELASQNYVTYQYLPYGKNYQLYLERRVAEYDKFFH